MGKVTPRLNDKNIFEFWTTRARKNSEKTKNIGNLEDIEEHSKIKLEMEVAVINNEFKNIKNFGSFLDLGCGVGFWTNLLGRKFSHIDAVDFSEGMLQTAKKFPDLKKAHFHCMPAQSFISDKLFDFIFISGLLIYLNDDKLQTLLTNIKSMTSKNSIIILRDGTSLLKERYLIDNKWSKPLEQNYSALYRTAEEYINSFESINFKLVNDLNMFPEGHFLNKHKETALRVYTFKRI